MNGTQEQARAVDALADLKRALRTAATDAIRVFADRTGLYPSQITIELLDISEFGAGRVSGVGDVRVRLGD